MKAPFFRALPGATRPTLQPMSAGIKVGSAQGGHSLQFVFLLGLGFRALGSLFCRAGSGASLNLHTEAFQAEKPKAQPTCPYFSRRLSGWEESCPKLHISLGHTEYLGRRFGWSVRYFRSLSRYTGNLGGHSRRDQLLVIAPCHQRGTISCYSRHRHYISVNYSSVTIHDHDHVHKLLAFVVVATNTMIEFAIIAS